MGVNSLPKTVTRQRRDCDLNPGPSAPESSTITSRLFTVKFPAAWKYTARYCTEPVGCVKHAVLGLMPDRRPTSAVIALKPACRRVYCDIRNKLLRTWAKHWRI